MDFSQRLSNLSPEQRERFLQKLQQQNIDILQLPIQPVKRNKNKGFPLSFAQERLWFIQQMEPENTAYNIVRITQLQGNLDQTLLEKSIHEIIKRHEILRTIFLINDETPVQVILPELEVPLQIVDLKKLKGEEQDKAVTEVIRRENLYSFDLTGGPLLRTTLLECSEDKYLFVMTIHHIITDGTSVQMFENELVQFYGAFVQGIVPGSLLPPLPIQYVDYACWQQQLLYSGSPLLKKQQEYWLNQFSGEIPLINLPIDFPKPKVRSFEGSSLVFTLEVEETGALKQLALNQKVTLYVLLLAILNVFLTKISGQEDIVIGTAIAGRRHPQLNHLMGMFVNTLALRNFPIQNKSFNYFLKETGKKTIKALENQDYQYEKLVGKVLVNRDTSRNPLFDVMFNFENIDINKVKTAGLQLKRFHYINETSLFDIAFIAVMENSRLIFTCEYCTRLFKEKTIRRFIQYIKTLISSVIDNPGIKISALEIITREEKNRLLFAFNDTTVDYPKDKSLHELFEKQVEQTPEHIAVVGPLQLKYRTYMTYTTYISYKELNEQSHQLAHLLQKKGIGPDTVVAIMLERSTEMIVGILGILKAGGAYLPIDPDYPEERINYMLNDSGAKILLTRQEIAGLFSPKAFNNRPKGTSIHPSTLLPFYPSRSSSLSYILYTSGSTGKPKGVLVGHQNVARLVKNSNFIAFTPDDRLLLTGSITFDITTFEIWWPLLNGLTLLLANQNITLDSEKLGKIIIGNRVSILHLIPQLFNQLAAQRLDIFAKLRYFLVGGDLVKPQYVNLLRNTYKHINILHMYGPTENTTFSTYHLVNRYYETTIPIGKPIGNSSAYIVDKYHRLVPIGVPGELIVGGDGVAQGYLNNPELTVQKFLFRSYNFHRSYRSDRSYITYRSYRTGDLARWLPDGTIEFLGRIDHQVKIRGMRIELGEIENLLLLHHQVKEAIVIAKQKIDLKELTRQYLCAYLVPGEKIDIPGLKEYLSRHLPAYMIPSYFMQMEKLPLTPSGKINRHALPEPEPGTLFLNKKYVPPGNNIEKILVETWQEVLGVKSVGITDNFFEIGGDSIKVIQIAARLKKYNLDLNVDDLFLKPVIKDLAKSVKETRRIIHQEIVKGKVPLTPIQQHFFENDFEDKHHFNQAVMVFRRQGFDKDILEKVFTKIVEHHDALRMLYRVEENREEHQKYENQKVKVLQVNRGIEGKLFDLNLVNLNHIEMSDSEIEKKIEKEANLIQEAIDLKTGPLVKAGLFKTTKGDHLLIVIHHLVVDGISWRILLEDFAVGYQSVQQGKQIKFQEKTDSFKYWAQKLTQYAAGAEQGAGNPLSRELEYWKTIDTQKIHPLPGDYQVSPQKKKNKYTGTVTVSLNSRETGNLLRNTHRAYSTEINDILLTALAMTLNQWAGIEKVSITLEGHGREPIIKDMDTSRTVGWFTTRYPVVLEVTSAHHLSYLIKYVKETLRRIPNKGIGYGLLRYLTPGEKRQRYAFQLEPEINFNYLGQFQWEDAAQPHTGLFKISRVPPGRSISPQLARNHTLDINGILIKGRLHLSFTYNIHEYNKKTIETLSHRYKSHLLKIIRHCMNREKTVLTPSDLGCSHLSLEDFSKITHHVAAAVSEETQIHLIYPLSPMQSGMLFHTLKDEESNAYFEQTVFFIDGEIEKSLLETGINKIIETYDVLRTVFIYEDLDTPLQIVLNPRKIKVYYRDIAHLKETEREFYLEEFKTKDRAKGFNLSRDTLIRFSLFKTGTHSYQLVWTFHHILMDGWCLGILYKELIQIYHSQGKVKPVEMESVTPYIEYIKWLETQDKETGLKYWQEYLEGFEESTGLPQYPSIGGDTNLIHDNANAYKVREYDMTLTPGETSGLQNTAAKNQVTLNNLFRTLWGLLLQKYSNSNDVVFGAVVSGRPSEIPGIEQMVGLFINTVPVRINSHETHELPHLLRFVQKNAVSASDYEYLPLAEIQANSKLKRNLINHIMVFENYPIPTEIENIDTGTTQEPTFRVKDIKFSEQTNYNFNIIIVPGMPLLIRFSYNALVYEKEFVKQVGIHFKNLINQVLDHPGKKISHLEVLSEEEKHQVLVEFNQTRTQYPQTKTVHELVMEQVEKTPDKIAVVGPLQLKYRTYMTYITYISYKELNEQSNRWAGLLLEKGIQPDTIVGLMIERSIEMIVGILAILKAGGAYLPIDPDYPRDRIDYMLKDSGAKILLTRQEITGLFSPQALNNRPKGTSIHPSILLPFYPSQSSNLAYILYTSGTTGQPKGVAIKHHNLVNFMVSMVREIDFSPGKTILALTTICFDIFVLETLVPLARGLKMVIADENQQKDPELLGNLIIKHSVQMLQLTPSRLKLLLDSLEGYRCLQGVKQLMVGGEAFPANLFQVVKETYRGKIYNMYGPTETTVWSTVKDLTGREKITIGSPAANTRIYIIDRSHNLQPIGISGELCIGGEGVARGYINRPQLTAEKFNHDLWDLQDYQDRYYRPYITYLSYYKTGDLARWLPDGDIECLGRFDHQVKIRGFRIEPGEIENLLLKKEEIKEAAVLAKENERGDKYLCAYIVPSTVTKPVNTLDDPGISGLREYLSGQLPDYMIPSYFVPIEKIPLTPSGKIDRKALPKHEITPGEKYTAPGNKIEKKLVEIWAKVLALEKEKIGIDDHFFKLGGHSLNAILVISRIHKEMDVKIPLAEVFKLRSIREWSRYIAESVKDKYASIEPVEEKEYYQLSSAQKRLYILQQMELTGTAYNMPGVIPLPREYEIEKLENIFKTLIQRHESLRTSFLTVNEEPVQRVHDKVEFQIEYFDAYGTQVEVLSEFLRPFDLSKAPLIRSGIVKSPDGNYTWMMDIHHIVSDGISQMVLTREFISLYNRQERKPLKLQYKDFSQWQNHLFAGGAIKNQEVYWLGLYSDIREIPRLNLPHDYKRPEVFNFSGAHYGFMLERDTAVKFKSLGSQQGGTIYMNILAALNALFYKYTSQTDIIIGSVISGRPHPELQHIIGVFVNTQAMRNYPEGEKTYQTLLKEVIANSIKAFENQDVQFDRLVDQLGLERDFSMNPLFDICMVAQDPEGMKKSAELLLTPTGETLPPAEYAHKISKFDMTFQVFEDRESIHITIEYYTAIFKEETIKRMASHFQNIVKTVILDPSLKLKDIELMSAGEKDQILYAFNCTISDYPRDKTLHELFAGQVNNIPHHIAVTGQSPLHLLPLQITYNQLNEKSNQLAHLLKEKGVQTDTIVGIMIERSIEMIIGILGILKAGAAYLPIDPDYPKDRIDYMMSDSGAKILLTRQEIAGLFSPKALNNRPKGTSIHPSTLLPFHPSRSSSLSYILYTSGSTGRPKGVLVQHQNVVRLVKNSNLIDFIPGDRLLLTGAFVFDITTFEIWWPLLNGLTLFLADQPVILDAEKLENFIGKNKISILHLIPQLFNQLAARRIGIFKGLRYFLVGGDLVRPKYVNKLRNACKKIKILHMYGPTENTTFSTYLPVNRDYEIAIPIGKPIGNSSVYIVDKYLRLVPIGVPGELLVGGDGVARGYLNNPQLTAQRFDHDGYHRSYRSYRSYITYRSYRTGDLARWHSDGTIEFLGRIDHQVKIRGMRIELGEIENLLLKHEKVKEAVVVPAKKDEYLCAYLVPTNPEEKINAPELKEHLAVHLPAYMIPSFFITLEKIPLTPTGKMDRKSLPQPEPVSETRYAAPRDKTEQKLVKIWAQILGRDASHTSQFYKSIGIDDNFFALGGHSLKATILAARIHRELEVRIPLAAIFASPTIRELAHYIKSAGKSKFAAITPIEKKEYYGLSSAQKRLYILQQMEVNATAYNMPEIIPLAGKPGVEKLRLIFKQLIQRHESLRTGFYLVNEESVQRIQEDVEFEIEYYDMKQVEVKVKVEEDRSPRSKGTRGLAPLPEGSDPSSSDVVRLRNIASEFTRPFDLTKPPLLRVGIIQSGKENHHLFIDMHHIITDGTSQEILRKEFHSLAAGKGLPLLKLQYKDFSAWQNHLLTTGIIKKQENFWLNNFAGEIPLLTLPYDYPRPLTQSFEGANAGFALNHQQTLKLTDIANKTGATIYMSILAIFTLLLAKLSGQEEIIVGTPVAGRRHADLEPLIGMFVNTIPLRNYPTGEKTFNQYLMELKEYTLEAFENQEYQFETLVEKMAIQRDTGRNPVFDVMFNLVNLSEDIDADPLPGHHEPNSKHRPGTSKFDINLTVVNRSENQKNRLFFNLEYCTRLFKANTIEQWIVFFHRIVDTVVQHPQTKISGIDILSKKEKYRILFEFNQTTSTYPKDKTIHELFAEQVRQGPDNIAIVGTHEQSGEEAKRLEPLCMTYKQLNQQANQLAYLLKEKGVQPDTIVALLLERTIKMIVGILGILKAGGAYLPIDPDYPKERIDYMMSDSGAKILLTRQEITGFYSPQALCLSEGQHPIFPSSLPSSLAYVIYTSGTTGKPKGTLIEHRNIVSLMFHDNYLFDFNNNDIWTMFHSYCFDFSVWEMYGALLYGGKLVLISLMTARDPQQYLDILKKEKVTILNQTPPVFYNLIHQELDRTGKKLYLRYVIFGGEALNPAKLKNWKQKYPEIKLINMFGITETTVHVTYKQLQDRDIQSNISNIGRPLPTVSAWVMDKNLNLVPPGTAGELCVGGNGVCRGYLNRPELTPGKFVENPHLPGEKLYRSGDSAKLTANGELEYLGRIDHQVKIRGHRIELGEIENQLINLDNINEAVVIDKIVRSETGTEKSLCAYIVSKGKKELDITKLKNKLSQNLPDYMIPSYFVQIEKIPLTANGKVNRKALPEPAVTVGKNYIAPRNNTEKKLVDTWAGVLDIPKDIIGIDDNFFDLGGHSLRATILASKMHQALNVKIPLAQIFKTPVIRELAGFIKNAKKTIYASISPKEKKSHYPVSSAQKRMFILNQLKGSETSDNTPLVVSARGKLDKNRSEKVIRKLIKRHEVLRTSFKFIDEGIPVQIVHPEVDFKIIFDEVQPGEIDHAIAGMIRPFDLSKAPLLRLGLFRLSPQEHIMVGDMHHIISDGTTRTIFINEFINLYAYETEDGKLPELKIQYKDFTCWQNQLLASDYIKKQEEYWCGIFKDPGNVPLLNMPTDFPRPKVQSFAGFSTDFQLSKSLTGKVRAFILERGVTLYMFLLAAYNILLSRWGGQEDIVVGTPIAGRPHADLENIIGMFVNTLPMRNHPPGEKTFREFLEEVKLNSLNAYENQDYQFEELVNRLGIKPDPGRHPLFDTMFVVQNIDISTRGYKKKIKNISFRQYQFEENITQFDIITHAYEGDKHGVISFKLRYCVKLFKQKTIERFIGFFKEIITAVVDNPNIKLKEIKLSHSLFDQELNVLKQELGDFEF